MQTTEDQARLKVIGAIEAPLLEGRSFPFPSTSPLYPENTLMAAPHVDASLQNKVAQALLTLTSGTSVCGLKLLVQEALSCYL